MRAWGLLYYPIIPSGVTMYGLTETLRAEMRLTQKMREAGVTVHPAARQDGRILLVTTDEDTAKQFGMELWVEISSP